MARRHGHLLLLQFWYKARDRKAGPAMNDGLCQETGAPQCLWLVCPTSCCCGVASLRALGEPAAASESAPKVAGFQPTTYHALSALDARPSDLSWCCYKASLDAALEFI